MSNLFGTIPVPAPGTEFGPPIVIDVCAAQKSFSVLGSLNGANLIVEASNKAAPTSADFAPFINFTEGNNLVRDFVGVLRWVRIRRVAGRGGPAIVGLACEEACVCLTGLEGRLLSLDFDPEREVNNVAPSLIFEEGVDFDSFPIASFPMLGIRYSALGRSESAAVSNLRLEIRIGGTPGIVDGAVIAASDYSVTSAPSPDGTPISMVNSIFGVPPLGFNLVKVIGSVPISNGLIHSYVRGQVLQFLRGGF